MEVNPVSGYINLDPERKPRITVELSEEENNLLAGHAAYNKCSRSSVVRKALNQYFNHTYTDKYSLLV